jgi:2-methylisocitrate lyase-like PEP mutase family enzyme
VYGIERFQSLLESDCGEQCLSHQTTPQAGNCEGTIMTNTAEKSDHFFSLHVKGSPLILYNIWDAGGAKAVGDAGAKAIATGSWSVASAHGYEDCESMPKEMVERIVSQIVSSVSVPVTVDFESGYASEPKEVAENVASIIRTGAVGINFEDQIVGTEGLYGIIEHCKRIEAVRRKSDALQCNLFINARTDLFLKTPDTTRHGELMIDTLKRAHAYRDSGASGFFAPGLIDEGLISDLCEKCLMPVNIMVSKNTPSIARLAQLGVARISYGPGPFVALMAQLRDAASKAFSD